MNAKSTPARTRLWLLALLLLAAACGPTDGAATPDPAAITGDESAAAAPEGAADAPTDAAPSDPHDARISDDASPAPAPAPDAGTAHDSASPHDSAPVPVPVPVPVPDAGPAADSAPAPAPDSAPAPVPVPVLDAGPDSAPNCAAAAADLSARLALPQSTQSTSTWYTSSMQGGWGPAAATYPSVAVPSGCDRVTFLRARVVAAASHYVGLSYQHHHVPGWDPSAHWSSAEEPGLDCSNFTSWVYNFGIGAKFTSNVVDQADGGGAPGRLLAAGEALKTGDLVYVTSADGSVIAHVVIYVDATHVIDSTGPGVQLRSFAGWYKDRYSHARRVIE